MPSEPSCSARLVTHQSIYQKPMSLFKFRHTLVPAVRKPSVWVVFYVQSHTRSRMDPTGQHSMRSFIRWSVLIRRKCFTRPNVNNTSSIRDTPSRSSLISATRLMVLQKNKGTRMPHQKTISSSCGMFWGAKQTWSASNEPKILPFVRTTQMAHSWLMKVCDERRAGPWRREVVEADCAIERRNEGQSSGTHFSRSGSADRENGLV